MLAFLHMPNFDNKLDTIVSHINLNVMNHYNFKIARQFIELAINLKKELYKNAKIGIVMYYGKTRVRDY